MLQSNTSNPACLSNEIESDIYDTDIVIISIIIIIIIGARVRVRDRLDVILQQVCLPSGIDLSSVNKSATRTTDNCLGEGATDLPTHFACRQQANLIVVNL
ncbi:uncharacterized protein DMAD_11896 [Drosophila madeirensis]|uniref:Uncharacterized protein n=1 Tax=Drosophila madeirensis TaxID=30013 RepID=A0AAU9FEU1_DROMD